MNTRTIIAHAAPHTTIAGFPVILDDGTPRDTIRAVYPASEPRAERTEHGGRIVRTYRVLAEMRVSPE